MFVENNIHTKIARNEIFVLNKIGLVSYTNLHAVEIFKFRGSGNRFFRRMNLLIASGRMCNTSAENKFLKDFLFVVENVKSSF